MIDYFVSYMMSREGTSFGYGRLYVKRTDPIASIDDICAIEQQIVELHPEIKGSSVCIIGWQRFEEIGFDKGD